MPQQRVVDDFQEDDFLPDDFEVTPQPEQKGLLRRGWDWLNAPLSNIPGMVGDIITAPYAGLNRRILGDERYENLRSTGKSVSDSFTSPANLATTALTGGTGLAAKLGYGALAAGLNTATRAASVPYAVTGAYDAFNAPTLGGKALGALESVGGILGARYGVLPEAPKPNIQNVGNIAPTPTNLQTVPPPVRAPHRGTSLGGMTPDGYLRNSGEMIPIQPRDIPAEEILDADIIAPGNRMLTEVAGVTPTNMVDDGKHLVRNLDVSPTRQQPLMLPAVGETSVQPPRFYQGRLGVADANMDYPNPLPGARNPGGSPLDYPEALGTIDAPTAAERGLGNVPVFEGHVDPMHFDPVYGSILPESMKPQPVLQPVPATPMRPGVAAPGRIDGESGAMGVAKLTKKADAKLRRELKRGEVPSNQLHSKLQHPAGGRVVDAPEVKPDLPYDKNRFDTTNRQLRRNVVEGEIVEPPVAKPDPYNPNNYNANLLARDPNAPIPAPEVVPPRPKLSRADKKAAARAAQQAQINADLASRPVNPRDRLITALTDAQPLSRAERKTFGGEFKPLQLDETNVKDLFNTIKANQTLSEADKLYAARGLKKILDSQAGKIPDDAELYAVSKVFGKEVQNLVRSRLTMTTKAKNLVTEIKNLPVAMMSTLDYSAPFRQGLPLLGTKAWRGAFDDMFAAGWDEKNFKAIQDVIRTDPNFAAAQKAGLDITDLDGLTNREEAMRSTWAERIPALGRATRGSNRAYTTFLNKTRMDTFNDMIANTKYMTESPREQEIIAHQTARLVNTLTGRGSIEGLGDTGKVMAALLFSPKLQASRVGLITRALGSVTGYTNVPKELRFEALKALFRVVAFGTTVGGVLNAIGQNLGKDTEVSTDPNNSDFGKLRIGDTRVDMYGGFQQYAVLADRFFRNQSTNIEGDVTKFGPGFANRNRLDLLGRYGYNKAHPAVSFAINILSGEGADNRPVNVPKEVIQRGIPIILQDLYELQQSDPKLIPLILPTAFGTAADTYGQERERP